ncbi:MAG: hypothetical protein M1480_09090 [Bacteroidetes bacterium]|nr:hypothetical protein [Bacteroidota bacterium]
MNIMKYFAYVIAVLFIILGIAILGGYFITENVPSQFRVMIGVVLVLYGAFRLVMTYSKKNESNEN